MSHLQKKSENKYADHLKNSTVRDHCNYTGKYRGAAHFICNLKFSIPKEIPAVHNGSKYDYHLFIRELAKEFEGELDYTGKSSEEYITISVPITNEIEKADKRGKELKPKIVSYNLKFTESARFLKSLLSNLVNNLAEGIQKIRCKYRHDNKKCEEFGIKHKNCDCYLAY